MGNSKACYQPMSGLSTTSKTTGCSPLSSQRLVNSVRINVDDLPALPVPPVTVLDRPPPYVEHDDDDAFPTRGGRQVSMTSSLASSTSSMQRVEYELLDERGIEGLLEENYQRLGELVKHSESVDLKLQQIVVDERRGVSAGRLGRLLTCYHQHLTTLIEKRHYVAKLNYQLRTRPQLRYHPDWKRHLTAVWHDMETARIGYETIQYEAEVEGVEWPEVRQREELLL